MPAGLPPAYRHYVDTGVRRDLTVTLDLSATATGAYYGPVVGDCRVGLWLQEPLLLAGRQALNYWGRRFGFGSGQFGPPELLAGTPDGVSEIGESTPLAIGAGLSVSFSYSLALTGLKLRVGYDSQQQFAHHGTNPSVLRYAWFCDRETQVVETGPGGTVTWWPLSFLWSKLNNGGLYYPGLYPRTTQLLAADIAAHVSLYGEYLFPLPWVSVHLSGESASALNITVDGQPLDCSDYLSAAAVGGSGSLVVTNGGLAGTNGMEYFSAPTRLRWNVDVTKHGLDSWATALESEILTRQVTQAETGGNSAAGTVKAPYPNPLLPPYVLDQTFPSVSWWRYLPVKSWNELRGVAEGLKVLPTTDPPVDSRNRRLLFYQSRPTADPAGQTVGGVRVPYPYQPAVITLAETVSVHRPQGTRPSDWTADNGHGSVVESAAQTEFTVSTAGALGAAFTRAFQTFWRARSGLLGTGDPRYRDEGHQVTKAGYYGDPEDVFGWESYGWARVTLEAPASGTVLLRAEGVYLDADASPPHAADTWHAEWTLNLTSGANVVELDLLFPGSPAGPLYLGRVERLKLKSFTATGVYRLSGLELFAKTDADGGHPGRVYLKHTVSAPLLPAEVGADRANFGGMVASVDGSYPGNVWSRKTYRTVERGEYGGALPWVDVQQVSLPQHTVESYLEQLDRKEGWTVDWSAGVEDAALQDAAGGVNAGELRYFGRGVPKAEWLRPWLPHQRLTPGTGWLPDVCPAAGRVAWVDHHGMDLLLTARRDYWAVIETLATQLGGRAPAGVTVEAKRVDTEAVLGSGVTDGAGYAVVGPLPVEELGTGPELFLEEA